MTERDIFLAALDHNDPADRADYLDRACGGNTPLRGRVEALLRADAASEGFLRPPAAAATAARPATAGPFELGEEVGRGGMGVVYRAWDARLDRHVAVKLLHDRAATDPSAPDRFRHEARVTARLAHPGIPPVHEVGELPDGPPYLAMKLVEGRTLAELLRDRPDPTAERGRLVSAFEAVCQAVAFAHSRGVVHRDLKPANVMVGAFGEVQVMDWGLAKVLADSLSPMPVQARTAAPPPRPVATSVHADTLLLPVVGDDTPATDLGDRTRAGLVLGTPGYMAPEQARGGTADRRADVYGLGAVLCDLLTGGPPFDGPTPADTLRANAVGDPAAARDRLARCGADAELVALCERCLRPDPADRPADAGVVAAEVAAWRARADERAQRAEVDRAAADVRATEERKRRRTRTVLGSAVAVVLAAGAGVSGWLAVLAYRAEGETREQLVKTQEAEAAAVQSAGEASEAAELARRKEWEARESAADAKAFGDYLVYNFLAATRPADVQGGIGVDVKVSDALARAEADIPKVFAGRPLAEARARHEVGVTWRNLGKYGQAEAQLQRSVELRESLLGPDHPDTLLSRISLAVTPGTRVSEPDREHLYRRALAVFEKEFGPFHQATWDLTNGLATTLDRSGRRKEAEEIHRRVLAGQEQTLGPDDTNTLVTVYHLARVVAAKGDRAEAEELFRRALAGQEKALGHEHPGTLEVANGLAALLRRGGDTAAAERQFRRVLASRENALGPNHPQTLDTVYGLAEMAADRKDEREALRLYELAYQGWRLSFGPDHEYTLRAACNVAAMYWRLGRHDRSLPLFEDIIRRLAQTRGPDDPVTVEVTWKAGENYVQAGRSAEALPLFERAYAVYRGQPKMAWAAAVLAGTYRQAGRPADAARVMAALVASEGSKWTPEELVFCRVQIGADFLDADPSAAESVLRESLTPLPEWSPHAWVTFHATSLLGAALAGQKKYTDAEPLLLKGYEGLKAREKLIPADGGWKRRLPEAADRLIALYATLGKPDQVKEWQAERAKYPREVLPRPRPDSAK